MSDEHEQRVREVLGVAPDGRGEASLTTREKAEQRALVARVAEDRRAAVAAERERCKTIVDDAHATAMETVGDACRWLDTVREEIASGRSVTDLRDEPALSAEAARDRFIVRASPAAAAVAAERERCAKVCDEDEAEHSRYANDPCVSEMAAHAHRACAVTCASLAVRIRSTPTSAPTQAEQRVSEAGEHDVDTFNLGLRTGAGLALITERSRLASRLRARADEETREADRLLAAYCDNSASTRSYASAVLRSEADALEQVDPLHPNGKCACAGEGRCAWCSVTEARRHLEDARDSADDEGLAFAFGAAMDALRALGGDPEERCPCKTDVEEPGPHLPSCPWSDPEYQSEPDDDIGWMP